MTPSPSSSSSSTYSSKPKTTISSPLSSCITIAYTKEELTAILLGDNSSISAEDRYVDVGLLAEIAAERIISGYASTPNSQSQSHFPLSSFIYTILHASSCHIAVLISALAQIDEFHLMMSTLQARGLYDFDEARNLFLAAYMVAARAVHGQLNYLAFWAKIVGGNYSAIELCSIEDAFAHMMGEWRDPHAKILSSLPTSDSDDDGTLVESDSDTDNDADDDSVLSKDAVSPTPVAVSPAPVVVPAKLELDTTNEDLLKDILKMAEKRLKASARRRSPVYAKVASLSTGMDKESKGVNPPVVAIVSDTDASPRWSRS